MNGKEIKEIIYKKALRYKVPHQYSKFYDSLSVIAQNDFQRWIANRDFGIPIIKFSHPNGRWLILVQMKLHITTWSLFHLLT